MVSVIIEAVPIAPQLSASGYMASCFLSDNALATVPSLTTMGQYPYYQNTNGRTSQVVRYVPDWANPSIYNATNANVSS